MKKLFVFILSVLVVTACLPQNVQVPQSPLLSVLERKSGLIGYVGIDGNMYVVDQSGQKPTQLTDDALLPENQGDALLLYQHPSWSRDGSQLAFIGIKAEGDQVQSNVIIANVDDDSLKEVYKSESEQPIYLNWSPDNENLSFISSAASGQIILRSVSSQGGDPTIFDVGSPYYWSWAPDGQAMIVHAGGASGSSPEHTAFLSIDSKDVTEQVLDSKPASSQAGSPPSFQAPAWSPDGSRIALARVIEEENQVIVTDSGGENPQKIGTFTTNTAFAWSGDGTRLAYLDGKQPLQAGTVGPLHVVDLETSEDVTVEGTIIAFFWSPSGEEVAYFVLVQRPGSQSTSGNSEDSTQTGPQLALELNVLDVASGESRELFTYAPSQLFMSVLPYFDQYHQSTTIWSPDSNNLVLSFVDETGQPGIAVVAASGQLEPRVIAQGYLAFWSWE